MLQVASQWSEQPLDFERMGHSSSKTQYFYSPCIFTKMADPFLFSDDTAVQLWTHGPRTMFIEHLIKMKGVILGRKRT